MIMIVGFILLVVLLIIGVPVLYCFATVTIFLAAILGYTPLGLFPTMYGKLANVVLLSIPLFIMAGGIMEHGKIGDALINLIETILFKVKGCLALVTTVACAVFGSICGSGAATLSCIGSIMLPKMRDRKYPMEFAAAIACCSAPIGMLIPPSSIQIVVAWAANLSVLACFLSTVIPGIILTTLLCVTSYFILKKNPDIVTGVAAGQVISFADKKAYFKLLGNRTKEAGPALFMPVLILGGIYGGIMTPTEAAAVSVFYAIPVAVLIYKGIKMSEVKDVLIDTANTTGIVMVMCVMTMVMGQILTMERVPDMMLNFFTDISQGNKIVVLIMINIFLVAIGMIMDDTCATMLCTPLLMPLAISFGISPYQMAAILGVNLGMGNVTPPTAPFLYMASQMANVNSAKVIKYVLILIACAYVPTVILTSYIPELATFLPKLILGDKFI
jgi:C4-dicarboxylate transporter DctM subunit